VGCRQPWPRIKDAHDRYANMETSFLLQRIEEYEGITILATNLRRNTDEAFLRRVAFIVQFSSPEEPERLRIWQGVFPEATPQGEDVDLAFMTKQFKLAGAQYQEHRARSGVPRGERRRLGVDGAPRPGDGAGAAEDGQELRGGGVRGVCEGAGGGSRVSIH
jgi:hypothetical protein